MANPYRYDTLNGVAESIGWVKMRLVLTTVLIVFASTVARADDYSIVTVPITANLAGLETLANNAMPNPLHQKSGREICVKAERACTKIPEFRGLKIYSRMECVDITPNVSCDLSQRIWGETPLRVSGDGGSLGGMDELTHAV